MVYICIFHLEWFYALLYRQFVSPNMLSLRHVWVYIKLKKSLFWCFAEYLNSYLFICFSVFGYSPIEVEQAMVYNEDKTVNGFIRGNEPGNVFLIQANFDMTDSMGPGKLVRHMQNPSYTYDTYLICMGLGLCTSSIIDKNLLYSGLSYPSLPVYIRLHLYTNKMLLSCC